MSEQSDVRDLGPEDLELPDDDPITVGELVQQMLDIRDERSHIEEKDKLLREQWRGLETVLMAKLDEQGMKRATVDGVATATLTVQTLPQVVDWDAFYEYVIENKAMHMLHRRVSSGAFRELNDAGEVVPGVDAYDKRSISLRKSQR